MMLSVGSSSFTGQCQTTFIPHRNPNFDSIRRSNRPTASIRSNSSFRVITTCLGSTEGSGLSPELNDSWLLSTLQEAKRVVLVRHGQSTWNEEGRIQGSSNFSVLTKKGENQAEISRQMLAGDQFDVCFASPLNRSKRTAEIIWGTREDRMITDYDLREIDLYSFQGLLKHEGEAKFGDAYSQWQKDPSNFVIDGHYPVRELWARARSCWNKVLGHGSRSVLVVAHNAVNQALIGTAIGVGAEYFRVLTQSNCGVSVLDFFPGCEGGTPYICLNRLNQTPTSPVAESVGRKTIKRIILVCHGSSYFNIEGNREDHNAGTKLSAELSQKVAELLLDVRVTSVITSLGTASIETAMAIAKVQEAGDAGTHNLVIKRNPELEVESITKESGKVESKLFTKFNSETLTKIWDQSGQAWGHLIAELSDNSQPAQAVVAVAHPLTHTALLGHCLNLTKQQLGLFHLDAGSITVIDFPDGPSKQGIVKCTNYTAHLGKLAAPITKTLNTR